MDIYISGIFQSWEQIPKLQAWLIRKFSICVLAILDSKLNCDTAAGTSWKNHVVTDRRERSRGSYVINNKGML
jgi:hypothetical protein